MNQIKKPLTLIATLGISLVLTACGGGSSTTESTASTLPLAKIDASNQEAVTAALFDSVDITTPRLPVADAAADESSLLAKVLPNATATASVSDGEAVNCTQGGTLTSSLLDNISVITYEGCKESNTTVNGEIKISYDNTAKEITYTLSDYSLVSGHESYTTPSTVYKVSAASVSYTTTGKVVSGETTTEFDNYRYSLNLVENKVAISIDGYVKPQSLENWIALKTNNVMQVAEDTCPLSGNLEAQGDTSKLGVTFANDKSVDVMLNGTLAQEYENCEGLPQG